MSRIPAEGPRAERTRSAVLEAAEAIFAERGVSRDPLTAHEEKLLRVVRQPLGL